MGTVSGSDLRTWDSQPNYLFDGTNANAFSADSVGHVIGVTVSGTTTYYLIQAYYAGVGMGGQGTNNAIYVSRAPGSAPTTGMRGAEWSYTTGTKPFTMDGGTNLIHYGGGFYYDPDGMIPPDSTGRKITISGGTGFSAGTYTITAQYATGFDNGWLVYLNKDSDNTLPSATNGNLGSVRGATWAFAAGGVRMPPIIPEAAYTGAAKGLGIGDSITNGNTRMLAVLQAKFPNASAVTWTNAAVSGSTSSEWVPGTANFVAAVAAGNANSCNFATICLGANDSTTQVPSATFLANIQLLVKGLFASIPTLQYIIVHGTLYTTDGARDLASLRAYRAAIRNVGYGAMIGSLESYALFQEAPRLLSDGVHPGDGGAELLARLWVVGIAEALNSGAATTIESRLDAIQAKTDNLPASPAAVGSAMTLADGAITAAKIASDAITATKIASDAITAAKIADGAIDTGAIADGAITAAKIASDAITSSKLASDAIGASEISAAAVTKIAAGVTVAPQVVLGPLALLLDGAGSDAVLQLRRGDITTARAYLRGLDGQAISVSGATLTAKIVNLTGTTLVSGLSCTALVADQGIVQVSIDTSVEALASIRRARLIVTRTVGSTDVTNYPATLTLEP